MLRRELGTSPRAVEPLLALNVTLARATGLVQRILAFGRQAPTSRAVLVASAPLREATDLLRATLPAGIALEVALADDELRVHADASQLQQVLINLGTNAWQAMSGRPGPSSSG